MTTLRVMPSREASYGWGHYTGIRVTALDSRGESRDFDVGQLTRESVIEWLYSGQAIGRDIQALVLHALSHEPHL